MSNGKSNNPNDDKIRLLIRDETNKLLLEHLKLCPFVSNKIEERTRTVETKIASMIGFMAGSGLLGGATGAALTNFLK